MAIKRQPSTPSIESDTPVSTLVVRAVSAATETPVDELPPLYHVVDPDALEMLFSDYDTDGSVEFQYAGRTVTVLADRTITISTAAEHSDRPANPQIK